MRHRTAHNPSRTTPTYSTTATLAVSAALLGAFFALLVAVAHPQVVAGLTVGLAGAHLLRRSLAAAHRWINHHTRATHPASQRA